MNNDAAISFAMVELTSQTIGERTTGLWCSACMLPCAEVQDYAILVKQPGRDLFEYDPVVATVTIWGCRECQRAFQLPDSPSLRDNREGS